jgi:BMFP domain-containing protein YqiC
VQGENRFFDDIARVASGALGTLTGVRDEIETRVREQVERVLGRMNLVRREEFDAVQAMVAKARSVQEALEERVALLEAKLVVAVSEDSAHPVPRRPVRTHGPLRKPKPAAPL